MKYLNIILAVIKAIKDIFSVFSQTKKGELKQKEEKKVEELKKETEKNVEKGEIDEINKNLML